MNPVATRVLTDVTQKFINQRRQTAQNGQTP
jgi:hypothetical protein